VPNEVEQPRTAKVERKTAETHVRVELNIDGTGQAQISTGVGFYDHMLTAFARHGRLDLTVQATGDLHIDQHHTMEDIALVIGQAVDERSAAGRASRAWGTPSCRWTRRSCRQ